MVNGSSRSCFSTTSRRSGDRTQFAFIPIRNCDSHCHSGRQPSTRNDRPRGVIETAVSSGCAPAVAFGIPAECRTKRIKGFQLGSRCRPSFELAEPQSHTLARPTSSLPVLRGLSQANTTVENIVASPPGIPTRCAPQAGERWTFQPTKGHDVAWIASHQASCNAGAGTTDEVVVSRGRSGDRV